MKKITADVEDVKLGIKLPKSGILGKKINR